MLDREIEPALAAVLQREAKDVSELRTQFQLVVDLLREESEDKACVLRQAHHLKHLLDRYFGTEEAARSFGLNPSNDPAVHVANTSPPVSDPFSETSKTRMCRGPPGTWLTPVSET